jgi:hypothetical protein
MYDGYKVSRGDIVTSKRFQYILETSPGSNLPRVGTAQLKNRKDPSATNARHYIAYVTPVVGEGPGQTQVVTALRLEGNSVRQAIQFEIAAVCHERVDPEELTQVGTHYLAPVKPNCTLKLNATSLAEAILTSLSIYGFAPTSEPERDTDVTYKVPGYKYDDISVPRIVEVIEEPKKLTPKEAFAKAANKVGIPHRSTLGDAAAAEAALAPLLEKLELEVRRQFDAAGLNFVPAWDPLLDECLTSRGWNVEHNGEGLVING